MKILYTSTEVRKEIVRLFSHSSGRRVAISAFVGKGAEAFLPNPKGLELICWPKAGGTNPTILRQLIKRGAEVYFADSLHMKLYWTEKGAVVTSANLSNNALGSGNLREVGVLLPANHININRIISSINCRPVSETELAKLDRDTLLYATGQNIPETYSKSISFDQWYQAPHRPKWKLGWSDSYGSVATSVKEFLIEHYGIHEPYDVLSCSKNGFIPGDWALTFDLSDRGAKTIGWMYIDFVSRIIKSDKSAYSNDWPYQAAQVFRLNRYPQPPFKTDAQFKKAFAKAVRIFGPDMIRSLVSSRPPKKLIELIHSQF